jgi:hypothetical protein
MTLVGTGHSSLVNVRTQVRNQKVYECVKEGTDVRCNMKFAQSNTLHFISSALASCMKTFEYPHIFHPAELPPGLGFQIQISSTEELT